jgi:hypothetical protein
MYGPRKKSFGSDLLSRRGLDRGIMRAPSSQKPRLGAGAPMAQRIVQGVARTIRGLILGLLAITTSECSGSAIAPLGPPIDVSGTWSGVVGAGSGGGKALRLTWTATQTGEMVSGPATLSTSPAVSDLTFTGTLTGVLTGVQLSLSYAGSLSGVSECSASGRGTAAAAGASISGKLDVTFSSCDALGLQPPADDQLALTRQ